jgi:TonB family protein
MLAVSLAAHVAIVAGFALMPAEWRSRTQPERAVMTVSLGGVEGPETGGMTSIAGRAVQTIAKPETKVADTPPAPKAPEMVEPERAAKPAPRPPRAVEKPAERSPARAPTAGPEIKAGSARVNTGGAAIPFGGLAQGGGGGGGVKLDVANFCCPEYLAVMIQRVRQNWRPNQGARGEPIVKFTIRRDGMITNVELERSSGQYLLDDEARRAVLRTQQLPPLPREFTNPSLTVHLTFDFQR